MFTLSSNKGYKKGDKAGDNKGYKKGHKVGDRLVVCN